MTTVPVSEIRAGDGPFIREFIADHCRITKDSFGGPAGEILSLRPWQDSMLDRLFARRPDGKRRHRTALIGIPRKNGKTAVIAGVALYGLTMEDEGAEVYSVAGDRDQARLVFGTAKRMVELDPELSGECKLYRDAIEVVETGSVYRALSAEAPLKEGLSPTLTVVDEVHVIDEDLWNVFALAMGARIDPLMVGITTAGARFDTRGRETLCYRMWDYGRRVAAGEIVDPTFYFEWWAAPEDLDYRDPRTWGIANPGYGDILDPEQLASSVGPTPEPEFRTKHLNQWVTSLASVFPTGSWDAIGWDVLHPDVSRVISPTEPVVLGLDGSWNGDSTALVGCAATDLHLFEVNAWEREPNDPHWRVEAEDVDTAVEAAHKRYNVVEMACDPHEWRAQMQKWERERYRITEWPTNSLDRMIPAWKEFYGAVMDKLISHDGSPGLARHVANAVLKVDQRGARPTKEYKSSGRKIDRLIAALIARDRAAWHHTRLGQERKPRRIVGFR
jgi:phage terminase large subunit-like protein